MRDATKWLCGLLVALMALTGPLLSRAAVVEAADDFSVQRGHFRRVRELPSSLR